ncbi:MAG TPA: hypothetical protein VKA00_00070 [Trueperaceae bacterium]|nr:hypothetical protein [Trueperaceae bacterium]
MYRNDPVVPIFAFLLSLGLFFTAYLDYVHIAQLEGHAPAEFSVGMIGLVSLGVVFLLYAMIGLVSVWLEGYELRPALRKAHPGHTLWILGVLVFIVVALSGLFAQMILYSQRTQQTQPTVEGVLFGLIAITVGVVLALYKRYYQDEDVRAEPEDSEVPW